MLMSDVDCMRRVLEFVPNVFHLTHGPNHTPGPPTIKAPSTGVLREPLPVEIWGTRAKEHESACVPGAYLIPRNGGRGDILMELWFEHGEVAAEHWPALLLDVGLGHYLSGVFATKAHPVCEPAHFLTVSISYFAQQEGVVAATWICDGMDLDMHTWLIYLRTWLTLGPDGKEVFFGDMPIQAQADMLQSIF